MVSQSILDGNRQVDTLRTVAEAEALLDQFVDEIKQKFKKAKSMLHPFSELSREEMWKLKAVVSKKLPNGPHVRETEDLHEARDLVTRLQEVRKQTKSAKDTLNSLSNYVEVTVNQDFLNSLSFDGNPIHIKKQVDADDSVDEMPDDSASFLTTSQQETVYLIEKSSFTLEHCTDIAIMDEHHIIASVGDSVQKRERKRMSFRQGISVPGAGKLCVIGETTEVSVLQQRSGHITVIETEPNLTILYRLNFHHQFVDISYLQSVVGTDGCPTQSPVFAVCYSVHDSFVTENIDLIQPKPTRYPGKPPTFLTKSTTIAESDSHINKSRFRGISNVATFKNRYILVGATRGVTCINKKGTMIWTIDLFKRVTQIMAYRTLIFVAVKDERKITTIGKQGHVIEDNIMPPMDLYPQKISAFEDQLIVKHTGLYKWTIFKKMYELAG
jgi:hypothetical protein